MWVFVDSSTGKVVATSGVVEKNGALCLVGLESAIVNASADSGIPEERLLPFQVTDLAKAHRLEAAGAAGLVATVEGGQVTDVALKAANSSLYVHISLSGGTEGYQRTSLRNDGVDAVTMVVAVRAGSNPASPVITALSGKWAIDLRHEDGGIWKKIGVNLVAGEATLTFKTTDQRTGNLRLDKADLNPITVGDVTYQFEVTPPDPNDKWLLSIIDEM